MLNPEFPFKVAVGPKRYSNRNLKQIITIEQTLHQSAGQTCPLQVTLRDNTLRSRLGLSGLQTET